MTAAKAKAKQIEKVIQHIFFLDRNKINAKVEYDLESVI
jgi:hypothetical protein